MESMTNKNSALQQVTDFFLHHKEIFRCDRQRLLLKTNDIVLTTRWGGGGGGGLKVSTAGVVNVKT